MAKRTTSKSDMPKSGNAPKGSGSDGAATVKHKTTKAKGAKK